MHARLVFALLIVVASSSVHTVSAHHSWPASYYVDQEVTVEGVVIRYLWRNPHVFIYLEVTNEAGDIEKWELEWGNTNVMTERGIFADTIREGDRLLVSGWPGRSAAKRMNLQKLERSSDGLIYPAEASAQSVDVVPTFRVDPDWPRVPEQWKLGDVSSVAIDAEGNAWLLHRPRTLPPQEAHMAAPAVIGFDSDGNFLDAWGGDGEGYEWPQREHGLHIDYQGFVWLGGNNCPARNLPGLEPVFDDQLLKFTLGGEFVMQIGRSNASRGNADTANLHEPADAFVHPSTNEIFVADGYGNHRVVVFDADTGIFKRMWGAFGDTPEDKDECPNVAIDSVPPGPGPQQFSIVHAIRVSNDGRVYVADRENRRVQVFTLEGEFADQIVWGEDRFARNLALSPDPEQQFLYVGGGAGIMVLDRRTLEILTTIEGDGVIGPGHQIRTDSEGNLYIAATGAGYQRLLFSGLVPR